MSDAAGPRVSRTDLADVVIPSGPIAWGDRIVYVAQRVDLRSKKAFSALWTVPRAGGRPRRLTHGDRKDRLVRADARGRFLVFVSDRDASDQIFRLDADGGDARRLTSFPRGVFLDVVVSPDGTKLAVLFSAAAPDDDTLPLAADLARAASADSLPEVVPGADHEAPHKAGTAVPERPRAPRARVTARFRNREDGQGWLGGRSHLWIVDAQTGDGRRLTQGAIDFSFPEWHPSGTALIACASRSPDDAADCDGTRNDLVRIDVTGGAIQPIRKPDGAALAPSVSPRGDAVAYVLWAPGDDFGYENVALYTSPLSGGEPRALTADLDRSTIDAVVDDLVGGVLSPTRPSWSHDGKRLTVVVTDRGAVRLWEQPLSGEAGGYVTPEYQAVGSPVAIGEGEFTAVVCDAASFPEIGIVTTREPRSVRRLSNHNGALAERFAPQSPERVTIERDGATLAAYYYPPRSVRAGERSPALLYVHGGPCVAYGERLFFEMQWLSHLGYAVLCTNPRGSQSYGQAHTSAIRGLWGEPDRGDQLAFVDWLVTRPEVDASRIGVAGGSYGGYMTLLLCATSDRFRAAIAERGLYNWLSLTGASDFGHCHARLFGGKWPWEDPARYLAASPMRLVANVKTPMMVVHQEGDLRVGTEQAVQLFNALKHGGVPTALVLFPEEDHGMTRGGRIDRRLERLRQIEAWLAVWLRDGDRG
jgi:dipeptidyl aminopeptidase/acylaminoacyl peptidase